eukprot:267475_1
MPTILTKELDELLLFGYIRTQNKKSNKSIPVAIIKLSLRYYYHELFAQLKWSLKDKSKDRVKLIESNKCAVNNCSQGTYGWILPDSQPVHQGVTCWRLDINSQSFNAWIAFGVTCTKTISNDFSTDPLDVYAISHNSIFLNDKSTSYHNMQTNNMPSYAGSRHQRGGQIGSVIRRERYKVDILFDADKGELKFAVLMSNYSKNELKAMSLARLQFIIERAYQMGWRDSKSKCIEAILQTQYARKNDK